MRAWMLMAWLSAWAGVAAGAELVLDFSSYKTNEPPPGFLSTSGGSGKPGDWRIIMDEAPTAFPAISPNAPANRRAVLAQLSQDRTDEHFPMLIYTGEEFGDFTLTTQFKLVAGEVEQMAGVAFRIQDEKNYYYIRASGLGSTFNFYKVVDGVRSPPIGVKMEITKGVWHELTIECKGNQIRAWIDGQERIPALGDKSFTSGRIAFWTKSDSVSYFADTRLVYKPKENLAQVLVRDTMKKWDRLRLLAIYARREGEPLPKVIASSDPALLGQSGPAEINEVIARELVHQGKSSGTVTIVLPLHDANGDAVAAVKVVMKSFPGQTERNAVERALPIVRNMEGRFHSAKELLQ